MIRDRACLMTDRQAIMDYIAEDNPVAAIELDDQFEDQAEKARERPTLYRTGRMRGTREIVVRPNYVMVYRVEGEDEDETVAVLRVLHATQQWPPINGDDAS